MSEKRDSRCGSGLQTAKESAHEPQPANPPPRRSGLQTAKDSSDEPQPIIDIEVAYALPHRQAVLPLRLPAGATVAEALRAIANAPPFDDLDLADVPVGVFGDRVERDRVLETGDRLEIYRPLVIDPREARRQRARAERHGSRRSNSGHSDSGRSDGGR